MSIAYNRVDWKHIEKLTRSMNFSEKWIKLIMECVTSITYKIIINGSPNAQIQPSRGLRRGDPISPYPFLLSMKSLSNGLNKLKEQNK